MAQPFVKAEMNGPERKIPTGLAAQHSQKTLPPEGEKQRRERAKGGKGQMSAQASDQGQGSYRQRLVA